VKWLNFLERVVLYLRAVFYIFWVLAR
jgi:hypothetical protein